MSADKSSFKVTGLKELRKALRDTGDDLQDFKEVNQTVADWVGGKSAQIAPRYTGMLASSWRPSGTVTRAGIRYGGASVPYANAVHWGTGPREGKRGPHNIKASLWATNTVHYQEPAWSEYYLDFIDRVTRKAGWE